MGGDVIEGMLSGSEGVGGRGGVGTMDGIGAGGGKGSEEGTERESAFGVGLVLPVMPSCQVSGNFVQAL